MAVSLNQWIGFHTMLFHSRSLSLSLDLFGSIWCNASDVVFFSAGWIHVSCKKTIDIMVNVYFSAQTRFIGLIVIFHAEQYLHIWIWFLADSDMHLSTNCNEQCQCCLLCVFLLSFLSTVQKQEKNQNMKFGPFHICIISKLSHMGRGSTNVTVSLLEYSYSLLVSFYIWSGFV